MMPRLASSQFGLLDDGVTLLNSSAILQGHWSFGGELPIRFRPVYWLFYALIYLFAGPNPQAFFSVNLVIYAATTALLINLVRYLGGTRWQAFFTGLLFSIAGPVFENYYTLSKSELLQVFGLLVSVITACQFAKQTKLWMKVGLFLVMVSTLLLVLLVKETSIIVVPISMVWFLTGWVQKKIQPGYKNLPARAAFLAASLCALTVYLLVWTYFFYHGVQPQNMPAIYKFTTEQISLSIVHWLLWIQHDYIVLFLLAAVVVVMLITQKMPGSICLYYDALIWMLGWMVIFIPYIYTFEYYMLPFAAGYAVFCGLAIGALVKNYAGFHFPGKAMTIICLLTAFLLVLLTIPNNLTNARLQLAIDEANTNLINDLAKIIPQDGHLYVNLPADNEYIYEIGLHLPILHNRCDISVSSFFTQWRQPAQEIPPSSTIIASMINNQPQFTVRLGGYSIEQAQWNQAMVDEMGRLPDNVYEQSFQRTNIDLISLVCPLLAEESTCSRLTPAIDHSTLTYRWVVYNQK
jgi:hypothetical protein